MGVIPWSPLSGGWLSGRWRKDADNPTPTSPARQRLADRYDLTLPANQRKLEALADRYDLTLPANQRKLEAAEALAQLAEDAGLRWVSPSLESAARRR
jgi:aryl-alcohol dehydrogenase-like predicted oxidoreductase